MSQVGEVVAKFRAETGDYLTKLDAAKAKNRELGAELVKTAGSAEKAMATLTIAKGKGALGDLGLDKRELSGVMSAIKEQQRGTKELANGWKETGKEAKEYEHVLKGLQNLGRGDFLKGLSQIGKGAGGLGLGGNLNIVGAGLAATAVSMIGEKLAEATKKALELKEAFKEGKINAAGIWDKVLEGLPIIGGVYQTTKNILDLMDDELSNLKEQAEFNEQLISQRERMLAILKQGKKEEEENQKTTIRQIGDNKVAALKDKNTLFGGLNVTAEVETIKNETRRSTQDFVDKITADAVKRKEEIEKTLTDKAKGKDGAEGQSVLEKQKDLENQIYKKKEVVSQAARDRDKEYYAKVTEELNKLKDQKAEIDLDITNARQREKDTIAKADKQADDQRNAMITKEKLAIHNVVGDDKGTTHFDAKVWGKSFDMDNATMIAQAKELGERLAKGIKEGFPHTFIGAHVISALDKAKSLVDQWKEGFKKALEEQSKAADKVIEESKTPAQKYAEHIREALANPLVTQSTKSNLLNKDYKELLLEQKDAQKAAEGKYLYDPKPKEIRGGQTLYVPPSKVDEKALLKLGEIKEELTAIKTAAAKSGITIENLQ